MKDYQQAKAIWPLLLSLCSVLLVIFGGVSSWFWKDGVAPGFTESTGAFAFQRFLAGFWPFGVIGLTGLIVGLVSRVRLQARRSK